MKELREMNELAVAMSTPGAPPAPPEAQSSAAMSERVGDLHWELLVLTVRRPGGEIEPQFVHILTPAPIELNFVLDDKEDRQKWARVSPGRNVKVVGRLSINEPNKIIAKIRLEADR
jgi:hypothetical protein